MPAAAGMALEPAEPVAPGADPTGADVAPVKPPVPGAPLGGADDPGSDGSVVSRSSTAPQLDATASNPIPTTERTHAATQNTDIPLLDFRMSPLREPGA
jgi:hypothetical protein